MNYNNVLNALEPYLATLTPTGVGELDVTYLDFPEDLVSEELTIQQALHAIIVLEVPLYWKGTSYKVVSASWRFQREILRFSDQPEIKSYGKTSRAANLYLRIL